MNNTRNRKPNRLKTYNYANNGLYFVTICVKNREGFFGKIVNLKMILNEYGLIANKCWLDLPNHYKNCVLHEYIIMPNHVHGIVEIDNDGYNVGTGFKPVPTLSSPTQPGLSEIIRGFKTFSSRRINEKLNFNNHKNKKFLWQRSFHDHIIRDERALYNIRNYIMNNPTHRD